MLLQFVDRFAGTWQHKARARTRILASQRIHVVLARAELQAQCSHAHDSMVSTLQAETKKKRKTDGKMTTKVFGAKINFKALRSSTTFEVCWEMRYPTENKRFTMLNSLFMNFVYKTLQQGRYQQWEQQQTHARFWVMPLLCTLQIL